MNNETMNLILTAVVVPLLVALTPMIVNFINLKAKEVKDKIQDAKLRKYIDIAEDAIETAVVSTMQTVVDAIKYTEEWTPETQKKIFNDVKLKAIAIMGLTAKEVLAQAYGDIDEWINNTIEYYVNANKI